MLIHISTVVVTLIVGYTMLALQMSITLQTKKSAALRIWSLRNWASLAAFLLLFSRLVLPVWFSAVGGIMLLLVGFALYSQAICVFLHGAAPRAFWVALAVWCIGVAALYPALDFAPRASIYS